MIRSLRLLVLFWMAHTAGFIPLRRQICKLPRVRQLVFVVHLGDPAASGVMYYPARGVDYVVARRLCRLWR
nr:MAG TPA: hypothetical protein [Caudoviricetes sp.]